MVTAEISPELSLSAQYFFEFRANRFPEGGTYLGPFDILYKGPNSSGAVGAAIPVVGTAGTVVEPKNNNSNFGLKATWSPGWAAGDLGFYYRQFDDVQPWALLAPGTVNVQSVYAQKSKLIGLSYEHTFGTTSTGFEMSYRKDTALSTGFANVGATGDILNVVANAFVQLGTTPFYQTGTLIAEVTYTQLLSVTKNPQVYQGLGYAGCPTNNKWDGCATKRALAVGFVFEPQWLQTFPGWDLSMPSSLTLGVKGNPAYAAGAFYAQGTQIYSIGIRGTYLSKSTVTLQYNGYHWRTGPMGPGAGAGPAYAGTGGNGPVALNDKGWVQLSFKTSF
jgi:hypothetical protein